MPSNSCSTISEIDRVRPLKHLAAGALIAGVLVGCADPNAGVDSAAAGAEVQHSAVASASSAVSTAGASSATAGVADGSAAAASSGGDFASAWGPATGSTIPMLAAADHLGQPQTLDSLAGEKGLLLVFSRSADW